MTAHNRTYWSVYLSGILLMLAAACVSMEAAKGFNERLIYAYKSVEAATDTVASYVVRGRLTKDKGREAAKLIDKAVTALDLARSAQGRGDTQGAEAQLALALDVLTALETYLKQEGK